MKIAEALKIIRDARAETPPHNVLLACGFTPLHAQTLLRAHLVQRLGGQRVEVGSGLYGDLCGTVESAAAKELHGLAVLVEWPDLDGRLSYRSGARWSELAMTDVLRTVAQTLARLQEGIRAAAGRTRVSLSGPTLPLPPLFSTTGWQRGEAEARLEVLVAEFLAGMAAERGVAVVRTQRLWQQSVPEAALDVKSDVLVGFPYKVPHADALTEMHARLLTPTPPLKAVITDLDDTLWHGIVGEVGPEGVSWDLASHHQMHGLYQNLLSSLAAQGTLIGVASKNDATVVEKAFERHDLLVRRDQVFPVEAHWEPKSGSVARILRTWNIGADAVIFIDDSPMELAEVAAAHPGIRTMLFPKKDPAACLELLHTIRDLCGKERVSAEDALRAESLRRNVEFQQAATAESGAGVEEFLSGAGARVEFDFAPSPEDGRVLELVNKTNQFNLNGIRHSEAEWRMRTSRPEAVLAVISYVDRFGPLGKIAVIEGSLAGSALHVRTWVMSCRAFSRRIEHQTIERLFARFGVEELWFEFAATAKNGPLQEFLVTMADRTAEEAYRLTRVQFAARCPALYHEVTETGGQSAHDGRRSNATGGVFSDGVSGSGGAADSGSEPGDGSSVGFGGDSHADHGD